MYGIKTSTKALEMIGSHQAELAEKIAAGSVDYDWMGRMSNGIAKWQGVYHVLAAWEQFNQMLDTNEVTDIKSRAFQQMRFLFNQVQGGADDEWSGRGNDGRRSYFDGVREAARELEFEVSQAFEKVTAA